MCVIRKNSTFNRMLFGIIGGQRCEHASALPFCGVGFAFNAQKFFLIAPGRFTVCGVLRNMVMRGNFYGRNDIVIPLRNAFRMIYNQYYYYYYYYCYQNIFRVPSGDSGSPSFTSWAFSFGPTADGHSSCL